MIPLRLFVKTRWVLALRNNSRVLQPNMHNWIEARSLRVACCTWPGTASGEKTDRRSYGFLPGDTVAGLFAEYAADCHLNVESYRGLGNNHEVILRLVIFLYKSSDLCTAFWQTGLVAKR